MESQRNFFTRRILGEILSSSLINYMSASDIDRMRSAFVSLYPGETSHNIYIELPPYGDGRRNIVAQICLYWTILRERVKDSDGNLWSYFKFTILGSIRESFQLLDKQFEQRLLCLKEVSNMVARIKELSIPLEIGEITHNNEQRIASEKIEKYFQLTKKLADFFSSPEGLVLRRRLRTGGNPRKIRATVLQDVLKSNDEFDKIEFKINERKNNWCPAWKSYTLYIKAGGDFVYLYRI